MPKHHKTTFICRFSQLNDKGKIIFFQNRLKNMFFDSFSLYLQFIFIQYIQFIILKNKSL